MTGPPDLAPPVLRLATTASTQDVAFDQARQGAPDRTVVVAAHQSAGRGRRGRRWQGGRGESLLLSILVRPRLAAALLPTLSLTTAVAVAEGLERSAGLAPRLKWPNDVLVHGRKIAGILVETRHAGAGPASAATAPTTVVGIGINLRQRTFPTDLAGRATSVFLESGGDADAEMVLAAVLAAFDAWRARLERDGFAAIRTRWLELADTIGRPVTVGSVSGVATGLDADGALLVDDGAGCRRVVAGDVLTTGEPAGGEIEHAAGR